MHLNHIKERITGRRFNAYILAFFPFSLFILGIILWIIEHNFNIISVFSGLKDIIITPTALYTDFLEIGGVSSALINSSIISFYNLFLYKKYKLRLNGLLIASFFTVMGFSFFGKNIYNIIPIYLGGFLYSKYQSIEFKGILPSVMFGTGLAPIISQITFTTIMPIYFSVPLGIIVGVFIGFIIVPLSSHTLKYHEGYNIYNIGFTAGIIGTVFTSILKSVKLEITTSNIIYSQFNYFLFILLYIQFALLIGVGFYINKRCLIDYKTMLKYKGVTVTDYTFLVGYGMTYFNMGLLGIIGLTYVYFTAGIINGPILAGLFSVVGFGAFGKHIKNCFPVVLGVFIFAFIFSKDVTSTTVIVTMLFSTTVAPIAGSFGFFIGLIAGMLHYTIALNISVLHGGLNLYNNGFAGGLVAGFLVPVIEAFKRGEK